MNKSKYIKTFLTIGISLVWLINGLFCKVLDFVPRHELIVSRILGTEYTLILTKLIGIVATTNWHTCLIRKIILAPQRVWFS